MKIAKFHKKLSKAQKIQREYNEKQKEFNVEDELQKLEQQVSSNVRKEFEKNLETTSKQTKELGIKFETKLETTSKELENKFEELDNKFKELERKLESNCETTKKLDDKLEEILRILKPE